MLEYKMGCLAKSLAGHDKGRYFVILKEDGEYVALADGCCKTVEKSKRKKKKHIQLINQRTQEVFPVDDKTIRENIKKYKRSHSVVEEVRTHVKSGCN